MAWISTIIFLIISFFMGAFLRNEILKILNKVMGGFRDEMIDIKKELKRVHEKQSKE